MAHLFWHKTVLTTITFFCKHFSWHSLSPPGSNDQRALTIPIQKFYIKLKIPYSAISTELILLNQISVIFKDYIRAENMQEAT
jgi:hypothetical protein